MLSRIIFLFALFFSSELLYAQHAALSSADIRVHLDSTRSLPIKGERGMAAAYVGSWYDFKLEKEEQVVWMYATVKVPINETPANTYYCVIQEGGFYTGMQQITGKQRQIIFSVWDEKDGNNFERRVNQAANINHVGIDTKKELRNYGLVACTDGGYFMVSGAGFTDYYLPTNTLIPCVTKDAAPVFTLPE
jgi:hypothetical protein